MSQIYKFSPRNKQPQQYVPPNPRWISKGLVALFDTRNGRELISGSIASVNSSTPYASTGGVGADFSSTANQRYIHKAAYAQTGTLSVFILCDVDTLSNYNALFAKQATTTTYAPYEIRVGASSADSHFTFIRASSGEYTAWTLGVDKITAGDKNIRLLFTDTGSTMSGSSTRYVWVNGIKNALTTNGGGTATGNPVADDGASDVWIGRRYDGATQLDGRIYFVALFSNALSDKDAKDLSDNPWDIFSPERRLITEDIVIVGGTTTNRQYSFVAG